MSKKKKKVAAKKGAKKVTKSKKSVRKVVASGASAVPSRRIAAATIFIYKVDGGTRIRTSPHRLGAGPGFIEWTVVNLASDAPVDVEITWPAGSPWGGAAPIPIRGGNARVSCVGAKDGIYKYNVTADGYTEDPELEFPWA